MKEYLQKFPDHTISYTRDKRNFNSSLDHLFIASIIKNWTSNYIFLDIFKENREVRHCYFRDINNNYYNVINGQLTNPVGIYKSSIKKSAFKKYIKNKILYFKTLFNQENINLYETIIIDDLTILKDGVLNKNNLNIINNRLDRSIFDEFFDINYINEIKYSELQKGDNAICPFDGSIKFKYIIMESPE